MAVYVFLLLTIIIGLNKIEKIGNECILLKDTKENTW